jgi:hypothetical protein
VQFDNTGWQPSSGYGVRVELTGAIQLANEQGKEKEQIGFSITPYIEVAQI